MENDLKSQQDEFKKKRQFNDFFTKAKAAFVNKDYQNAGINLKEALLLYPDDLDARELAADILLLNGKVKEASKEYKAIYDADNTRGQCEEKYAKTVLTIYNSEEKQKQFEAMLHGETTNTDKKTGYMIFLSCIIPGLGRVIYEQYLVGIIFFVLYFCFIGFAINHVDIKEMGMSGLFKDPYAILADIVWIVAFIDTISLYFKNK